MDTLLQQPEQDPGRSDHRSDASRFEPLSIRGVLVGTLFGAVLLGLLSVGSTAESTSIDPDGVRASLTPSRLVRGHLDVRDTLYTTDHLYLDVDLQRQVVTVRRRGKEDRTFLISSGTPYISDGMSTPPGIFTVQNMVPMAISRQFNDARLHNWIGVVGGIGFHGLDGNGYYGYLGKRPSSHGCIRMARDEIADMYDMIHVGAPIYVRNGETARVVAFCDPADTVGAFVIDSTTAKRRGIGAERLEALYDGRIHNDAPARLVHIGGTKVDWPIKAGRKADIPRQEIPERIVLPSTSRELHREG